MSAAIRYPATFARRLSNDARDSFKGQLEYHPRVGVPDLLVQSAPKAGMADRLRLDYYPWERFEEVSKREIEAAWIIRYDALKPQRDALAEEVKTAYAEAVAKLVPMLSRIEPINAEISRLHQSKPLRAYGDDDGRWLAGIPTLKLLALPNPDRPGELSWPPPANVN
jgi:hypothetical protein